MSSTSATCFSSNRNDHRPYPGGGAEQANAINRASTAPVTTETTGGSSRCFREIVACASPPVSANRLATSRNVSPETPSRAASTSFASTSPPEVSNASSTRARMIIEAGCTPVLVSRTSSSRSDSVNTTGRFFCEPTTPILFGRAEKACRTPPCQPNTPELSNDTLLGELLDPRRVRRVRGAQPHGVGELHAVIGVRRHHHGAHQRPRAERAGGLPDAGRDHQLRALAGPSTGSRTCPLSIRKNRAGAPA